MRELRPGTVIAVVALFIAIGGTATAASGLINGKKIKPGTITAKQIKNKSITKNKLAPAAIKSLEEAQGPAGPAGQKGATGATGPAGAPGANGIVSPYYAEVNDFFLPRDQPTIPLTLEVEPGTYMLQAKLNVWSQTTNWNYLNCTIWTDEVDGVDAGQMDSTSAATYNLAMMAVAEVEKKVELRCMAFEGNAAANNLKLIAVPVQ